MRLPLALSFALLMVTPALAVPVDYYVRTDGYDTDNPNTPTIQCDGTHDLPYSGSTCTGTSPVTCQCAFATINRGELKAKCGDTVHVGPGTFLDPGQLDFGDSCTAAPVDGVGGPKIITGSGPDITTGTIYLPRFARSADPSGAMTCAQVGSTNTYNCTIPNGASTTLDTKACLLQRLNAPLNLDLDAQIQPFTVDGFLCLTPSPDQTCDPDGFLQCTPGTGDCEAIRSALLTSDECHGVYTVDNSTTPPTYLVHPWNNEAPGAGLTKLYAPSNSTTGGGSCNPSGVCMAGGDYLTLERMAISAGFLSSSSAVRITLANASSGNHDTSHNTLSYITTYGVPGVWVNSAQASPTHANFFGPWDTTLFHVRALNDFQRVSGVGCGRYGTHQCLSNNANMFGTAMHVFGDTTHADFIEATSGGRQGLGLGGNNNRYRQVIARNFPNHGFQMVATFMNSTIENALAYNNQEGMLIDGCQRDVTFKHVTITGSVAPDGSSASGTGTNCPDDGTGRIRGQWNLDWQNSAIKKFTYNGTDNVDPPVDPRGNILNPDGTEARGLDDQNIALWDDTPYTHRRCSTCTTKNFTTVADWRAYTGGTDSCTDCQRDTALHSVKSTAAALFQGGSSICGLSSCTTNFTPAVDSPLINAGDPAYAPSNGLDVFGNTRVGNPDIGAVESAATVTPPGIGSPRPPRIVRLSPKSLSSAEALITYEPGELPIEDTITENLDTPPATPTFTADLRYWLYDGGTGCGADLDAAYAAGTAVTGEPTPEPYTEQSVVISGLTDTEDYCFGVQITRSDDPGSVKSELVNGQSITVAGTHETDSEIDCASQATFEAAISAICSGSRDTDVVNGTEPLACSQAGASLTWAGDITIPATCLKSATPVRITFDARHNTITATASGTTFLTVASSGHTFTGLDISGYDHGVVNSSGVGTIAVTDSTCSSPAVDCFVNASGAGAVSGQTANTYTDVSVTDAPLGFVLAGIATTTASHTGVDVALTNVACTNCGTGVQMASAGRYSIAGGRIAGACDDGVLISAAASYLDIDSLKVDGCGVGLRATDGAHVDVRTSQFTRNLYAGIRADDAATRVVGQGNTISYNGGTLCTPAGIGGVAIGPDATVCLGASSPGCSLNLDFLAADPDGAAHTSTGLNVFLDNYSLDIDNLSGSTVAAGRNCFGQYDADPNPVVSGVVTVDPVSPSCGGPESAGPNPISGTGRVRLNKLLVGDTPEGALTTWAMDGTSGDTRCAALGLACVDPMPPAAFGAACDIDTGDRIVSCVED